MPGSTRARRDSEKELWNRCTRGLILLTRTEVQTSETQEAEMRPSVSSLLAPDCRLCIFFRANLTETGHTTNKLHVYELYTFSPLRRSHLINFREAMRRHDPGTWPALNFPDTIRKNSSCVSKRQTKQIWCFHHKSLNRKLTSRAADNGYVIANKTTSLAIE